MKKFIITLAFTAFSLTGCMDKKETVTRWNLQSHSTESSLEFKELLTFAENVKVMSSGRFIITPLSGGKITNGPDIYLAVKDGRAEMGNGWPNWWSGQNPAWAIMNAGPFDFMNLDASMMFFINGKGTEQANKLSKDDGVVWRAAWWPGMEFGLLSKKPIPDLSALKGKKVRIGPGLPSEVLTAASGAYTIPLIPQEIEPALKSGDIDAVEWTTSRGVLDLGIHKTARHAIVPAVWQPSVLSDFLINEEAYTKLPEDLKKILEVAIKAYSLETTLKSKEADMKAFKELKNTGLVVNTWSADDIKQWRKANEKIIKKYKRDSFSKELIEQKQEFKRRYNEYYKYFKAYE